MSEHDVAEVTALFERELGILVTPDTNFFEAGGYSLSALRLLARIRETFGSSPSAKQFFADPTPAGVAILIGREYSSTDRAWTRLPGSRDAARAIIFLPPSTGSSLPYFTLNLPDREAWALEGSALPGLPRHPISVEELTAAYTDAIIQRFGDRHVVLAGWSFGALMAGEVASSIERLGRRTAAVLIDPRVPLDAEDQVGQERFEHHAVAMCKHHQTWTLPSRSLLITATRARTSFDRSQLRKAPTLNIEIAAGHFEILKPPHVQEVVDALMNNFEVTSDE